MVGKMPNVTWLEGSYVETIKGWQSGWFYITKPHDTNWVAAPEFQSGIPHAAHLLERVGPVLGFLGRADRTPDMRQNMMSKKIKLVNVVQVMLFRRVLPCQLRAFNLREFDPASTRRCKSSSTRRTRTSGRCCSRVPRYLHPLPRTADSAQSALPIR